MLNESDNKMDELLKTYAQKRKADASGSFELHPATRRLLQAEVAKLRPKGDEPRKSWLGALVAHWPRVAFGVGLFAVLGFALWRFVPAWQQTPEEQLLAKNEPSHLASQTTDPVPSASVPPTEVAQTVREATRPTNKGMDSDEFARSRRLFSDRAAERREAQTTIPELASNTAASSTEEIKKKQSENSLSLNLREADSQQLLRRVEPLQANPPDQRRRQKAGAELDSAAVPATPQPAGVPTAPAPVAAADRNITASVEVEADRVGTGLVVQRGPTSKDTSAATAGAKLGSSLVFFHLGTFTNAPAVRDGLGLNSSQFSETSQTASSLNTGGLQSPLNANRRYGKYAVAPNVPGPTSGQTQLRVEERPASLVNNGSRPNLQLNQALGPQLPTAGKDAAVARDKSNNSAQSVASRDDQNLSGRVLQFGNTGDFRDVKRDKTAGASVLAAFALEQSGSLVRVLDADGSIYEGAVTLSDDASVGRLLSGVGTGKVLMQQIERNRTSARSSSLSVQESIRGATGSQGVIGFRVAGTNSTLKLPVVLEGTFWGDIASDREGSVSKELQAAPEARQQSLAENGRLQPTAALTGSSNSAPTASVLRVTGRARVGGTNEIRIDAVRSGD